jgi:hypothetical protein
MPMAGRSTRFNLDRPKWMLTDPSSGTYMALASLQGINLNSFKKLYFVFLKKHQEEFNFEIGFTNELSRMGLLDKSELIFLINETDSPAQTVYKAIEQGNIQGSILIKDSDSYFELGEQEDENFVAYESLENTAIIDAKSKSYLQIDQFGIVNNIVEKKVISSKFSVGGYGFISASKFSEFYSTMEKKTGEIYISDVIFEMILAGFKFRGVETHNYEDWGTLESWKIYCNNFKTLFVDIDGTLVENSSLLFKPYLGDGKPIQENIDILNAHFEFGKSQIILTTSRPEFSRLETELEMQKKGIKYHQLIMGLQHSVRVLINDFSTSNNYPTSVAINIPRNSNDLSKYLGSVK